MMNPDFKEFSRLAQSATLVPLVKSVSADLLTPVSAFLAIAEKEPNAFLLESVERGEQIGRYTFLGARPYMRLRARGSAVEIERGRKRERRQGNVFEVVKQLLSDHKPASVPVFLRLPPGRSAIFPTTWYGSWRKSATTRKTIYPCRIVN